MEHFARVSTRHCHSRRPDSSGNRKARFQIACGMTICGIFIAFELIGAHLSKSLAIYTDAAHLGSDFISFGLSFAAIYMSQKEATQKMSFGYYRFEVLGALASIALIWALTAVLVFFAIDRIMNGKFEIDSLPMLVVSISGLVINVIMWLAMSDWFANFFLGRRNYEPQADTESSDHHSGHHHHHHHHHHQAFGHSHGNLNVRAAMLHILGDIIQSIGVFISSLLIYFWPKLKWVDPVCTLLFAAVVVCTTRGILVDCVHILMEGFPDQLDYETVCKLLFEHLPTIRHVHSLHVWSLTHSHTVLAVHLTIDPPEHPNFFDLVRIDAENVIRDHLGIHTTTIQVELHQPKAIRNCVQCLLPPKQ